MSEKELKQKYDALVKRVPGERMYDGRDKGVDVYICKKCGAVVYTRYKDKGVTPFTIACRNKDCKEVMMHEKTISEMDAMLNKVTVQNWVRPTFEWLNKQRKKGNEGVIEHVLNGGLVMESEL